MEKTTAGILGAIAGLASMGTAQAANQVPAQTPEQVMQVSSYADLLAPVGNAAALLREMKLRATPVQYYQDERPDYHHHHHHHHHYYPPPPPPHHHHHHHHHQSGLTVVIPGLGVVRN